MKTRSNLGYAVSWVLFLVCLAVMPACTKHDDSLTVGAILPLTGRFAQLGEPIKDAMDLAAEDINAAGGILGKPVRILYVDSQGDPKAGVAAAQKLIEVDRVGIVTTFLTGVSEAVKPVTEQAETLLLAQTVSPSITQGSRNVVRMHYSFVKDGELLAAHLLGLDPGPVGFVRSSDPSTSFEVEKVIIPALRSGGITDIFDETFNVGNKDFKPHAVRLKAAGAKQVCILGYGSDIPGALRELNTLGMLEGAAVSGNLGFVELPADTPPELYTAAVFTTPPFLVESEKSDQVRKFERDFAAKFGKAQIGYSAYYAYDTLQLLKEAAEKAESLLPAEVRKAISQGEYALMTGTYRFSAEGDAHPPAMLATFREAQIVALSAPATAQ